MAMPHRCGYSFLKYITPGKGCARCSPTEVQLRHSRKKTSFFVCGSDLPGHSVVETPALGPRLPVTLQAEFLTARTCPVARMEALATCYGA